MIPRVYLLGTDTHVGKTTVACAILREARTHGCRILPFKPAQSGPDEPSDADRLLEAANLSPSLYPRIAPLRYHESAAPGLAEHAANFLDVCPAATSSNELDRVCATLGALEAEFQPTLTLIEGAGGLHVPMPGGTWQPTWLRALRGRPAIVARAGLGTINHTLLTIDALRNLSQEPLGFFLSCTNPDSDAVAMIHARVIVTARSVPHLGTLRHGEVVSQSLLLPLLGSVSSPTAP